MTVALHHRVEGQEDGPVLVLLNSLGTDLGMWDDVAAILRSDFRLVRLDARGHGESPTPPGPWDLADLGGDVLALLDSLGIARASFAGVSVGGSTALWIAAHEPDRIERLVVCFTAADFGPAEPWLERAASVRADGVAAISGSVLKRWVTPAVDPAVRERMRAMLEATPPEGYAATAETVGRLDLREDLAAVAAPTLVIAGAEDRATPPERGREIAAGVPGAEFVELPGAAHLGNVERPREVAELIRSHLREEFE